MLYLASPCHKAPSKSKSEVSSLDEDRSLRLHFQASRIITLHSSCINGNKGAFHNPCRALTFLRRCRYALNKAKIKTPTLSLGHRDDSDADVFDVMLPLLIIAWGKNPNKLSYLKLISHVIGALR